MLPEEDAEETVSDVFTALWYSRLNVEAGALKAYIAAIARNKAKSRLRAMRISEPLQDDFPLADCKLPEEQYILDELGDITRRAVESCRSRTERYSSATIFSTRKRRTSPEIWG